ncbi:MAG: hypothetical protein ACYTFT_12640, partial [Planctomycetota bacterium]
IYFHRAEAWAKKFWQFLQKGDGVTQAANKARGLTNSKLRKHLSHNIYRQPGVPADVTLHPARYGKL